jgi:hypothetical protein
VRSPAQAHGMSHRSHEPTPPRMRLKPHTTCPRGVKPLREGPQRPPPLHIFALPHHSTHLRQASASLRTVCDKGGGHRGGAYSGRGCGSGGRAKRGSSNKCEAVSALLGRLNEMKIHDRANKPQSCIFISRRSRRWTAAPRRAAGAKRMEQRLVRVKSFLVGL